MNRGASGITLVATIALMTLASAPGASAPPAASRLELAPSPTPSPPVGSLTRVNAPTQAQRTAAIKQIVGQRMSALSHLPPRSFKAPRSVANAVAAHQDVQVAGHAGAVFNHLANYCAQRPPEIDTVSGDVTPGGTLTIHGICFGTSGNVRLTGIFPYEPSGFNLQTQSWTDAVVKVQLVGNTYGGVLQGQADSFTSAPDQPVELRLATHRVAAGMTVYGANVSLPVRLNFRARRALATATADLVTCAVGEPLDASLPDLCAQSGWFSGALLAAYHVRKAATSGEDVYAVNLKHGFVLDQVSVQGDAADVSFDPSLDPSHVTFRIRWRTVHKSDPERAKVFPQYADYNDGSYAISTTATGPDGLRP